MDLKKIFGLNVQKYRKLNNYTQEKLAELASMDTTTVSLIERGKCFSSAETLMKLATSLNINVSDLFFTESANSNEEIFIEISNLLKLFKNDNTRLNAIKSFMRTLV